MIKIVVTVIAFFIILLFIWAMCKAAGMRSRWEERIENDLDTNNKENNDMNVNIKKLRNDAIIPHRGSDYAAGYDLYSCHSDIIQPHETKKFGTGLAIEIPHGYFGAIFARSGLATKQGLRPSNCVGVVDEDYRGEYIVAIHNDSNIPQRIERGVRIAQLVIIPYLTVDFNEVDELSDTQRGMGGFGSTGTK